VGIEFEGRNTMKRILIALFCLAGVAAAQTAAPPPVTEEKPKWLQEVIDVKYADAGALAELLGSMVQGGSPDRVKPQPNLRAISIGTYDPAFLKLAEEIVKRYDVPRERQVSRIPHQVEVVVHILLAAPKGSSGDALPPDMEPVAKQIRSVFGYANIRLLDSALLRDLPGRGSEVSGMLSELAAGLKAPTSYRIQVKDIYVEPPENGNSILLSGFKFSAKIPYEAGMGQYQFVDVGFETDLFTAQGQKVVVGKSGIGANSQALILVLSARVVE
jgi:hypothetical protein